MGSIETPTRSWEELRDAKKAEQESRIPVEWKLSAKNQPTPETRDLRPFAASSGILTERELEITGDKYDASGLLEKIADGTYSAVEVTTAYCKRAAISQQLCNSLTEIMFLDAIEEAKKLDEHYKATGKTIGPLHGLPMTFKECFHVKGYDASDGYISRTFQPSTYDTYLVGLVKDLGATVIAKTNTPQSMLAAEAHNNVFGRTKNPVVSQLTSGGSSGGEGSVVAFHGSALGIGTDVGGSIRIPCAANGIYGYKPSFGVLPMIGYAASNWVGMNTGIPAVLGPMARSARDLSFFTKIIRDTRPWLADPAVIPSILEKGALDRRPVVGVIYKSGLTPHPPIRRALQEAVSKLEAAGFEVKEFIPQDFFEINKVTRQLFTLDGMSYPKQELSKAGEPVVESVQKIKFFEEPRKTWEEAWQWSAKKGAIQVEMLRRWQEAKIDIVLAPAGPHTAVLPGDWSNDIYTVTWNCVDYPCVIMPVSTVDPAKDIKDAETFQPLNPKDEEVYAWYDPELMAGAPVALQLVGPRLGDEQLLKDAELIDSIIGLH